jgi:hypothetical protein
MSAYGFGKQVQMSFDDAAQRAKQALACEGFGVLTEIDVAATLKKKIDQTIPPYVNLGACNPAYASKALEADPQIGLLLPCNVVVPGFGGCRPRRIHEPCRRAGAGAAPGSRRAGQGSEGKARARNGGIVGRSRISREPLADHAGARARGRACLPQ